MKLLIFFLLAAGAFAAEIKDLNALVLAQTQSMPKGGRYLAGGMALSRLRESVSTDGQKLKIDPAIAVPSFCSGATYLVFLKTIQSLAEKGALSLDPAAVNDLAVAGQSDGIGVWGRWNANGPGTARFFHELGLGSNFQDFESARPGDFMKIFWTKEIGRSERGHSVIFLGVEKQDGVDFVRFWSSNLGEGYGEKSVPKSKIAYALFSRLENPGNLNRVRNLIRTDLYLAQMLTRRSTVSEVRQACGIPK